MNKQILLGSILGDMTIEKLRGKRKTTNYSEEHSLKQEEYLLWKVALIGIPYKIYRRERIDKRTNKTYYSITVKSSGVDLLEYRKLFYNPDKQVTREILDLLDPQAIAVWFCDDGCMYYNGNNCHLTISTDSFNNNLEIIKYFKEKWDLNFKICQKKRIRLVSKKECEKFFNLFGKEIPKCMEYKLLEKTIQKYKIKKYGEETKDFDYS